MALWVCLNCTTKYAVRLFRCPRCHGTEFVEDGQPMPKITRHGGATNAAADAEAARSVAVLVGEQGPELVDLPQGPEGSDEPSPGNSSSESTETQPTNSEPSAPNPEQPAPTTASRSGKGRTAKASTALSTDGDLTAPTSAPDAQG